MVTLSDVAAEKLRAILVEEKAEGGDMLAKLASEPTIVMEIAKYLAPDDLLNLYSVHRPFNWAIDAYLRMCSQTWTKYNCPEAAMVYNWRSAEYRFLTKPDPVDRPPVSPITPSGRRTTSSSSARRAATTAACRTPPWAPPGA